MDIEKEYLARYSRNKIIKKGESIMKEVINVISYSLAFSSIAPFFGGLTCAVLGGYLVGWSQPASTLILTGYALIFVGATLNRVVVACNEFKMPVAGYVRPEDPVHIEA